MIEVTFNQQKFQLLADVLETAPVLIREGVIVALTVSAMRITGRAAKSGYAPRKTGALARSIGYNVNQLTNGVVAHMGSNLPYARIHEFGGVAGKGHNVHIVGKFYMTRAFAENRDYVADAVRKYATIKALSKR